MASPIDKSGKISTMACARRLLPTPGGPLIRRLCPPLAAIVIARLAFSCPFISEKSGPRVSSEISFRIPLKTSGIAGFLFSKISMASSSVSSGITLIPSMTTASEEFSLGRKRYLKFPSFAISAILSAPFTGRRRPSRLNSPTKILSPVSNSPICFVATR